MIIVKYIFDHNIYANLIPQFNEGYIYTIKDEVGTYTTRTIESDVLPTKIQFGNLDGSSSLLEVLEIDTKNVTNMNSMFRNCKALTSLDLSNFDTSSVTSMNNMFQNCNALTSLDVSNFDTSSVTNIGNMFNGCNALTSLDLSGWDTKNVMYMDNMFNGCKALTSLDLSGFDTNNVTVMNSMFYNCKALTSLDLSGFDTSSVTNMDNMFNGCNKLTSLDVSNFDTSSVTNMASMFSGCNALTSLDVSNFDTSSVTNIGNMFNGCNALTSLDLSGWDTKNVMYMDNMFNGCKALTSLDVSGFDTTNVTSMWTMFNNCNKLTSLDVSSFDTSNVKDMNRMFYGCNSLVSLDVSGFDTSNVKNMDGIFNNCNRLTDIGMVYCSKDTVEKIGNLINASNVNIWIDMDIEKPKDTDKVIYKPYVEDYEILLTSPLLEGDTIEEIDGDLYHVHRYAIRDYQQGDEDNHITDLVKTIYQLAEPTYEKIGTQDELKFANEKIKPITSVPLTDTELNYTDDSIRLTKESRYVGNEAKLNEKFSNVELSGNTLWIDNDTQELIYAFDSERNLRLQSSFEEGYDEESGKYKVEYKVTGKNKFNVNAFVQQYNATSLDKINKPTITFNGDEYIIPAQANADWSYSSGIGIVLDLIEGQILYTSGSVKGMHNVRLYNLDNYSKQVVEFASITDSTVYTKFSSNYTVKKTGRYFFRFWVNDLKLGGSIKNLYISTVDDKYEPYKEYTKTLYLNSPLLEGDRIIAKNDGLYHEHNRKQMILDGSKLVPAPISIEGKYRWEIINSEFKICNSTDIDSCICDRYPSTSATDIWFVRREGVALNSQNNRLLLYLEKYNDGSDSSKQQLINELQQNPTTVVYELASPYLEKISDDILLAKVASTGTLEVQSAVPCSEIALTNAKKELKYLYANKDYTVQFVAHGQGEVVIDLGGTNKTVNVVDGLNTFQIKTPSTLLHNNLYLNGTDIYVEDIVVTDSVQENIGYFDGLQSSYEDKEIEFVVTDENDKVVNRKKYTLSSSLLKDDTIECIDGKLYHVHRYGKVVFNSSSSWAYNSTISANSEFYAFYKSDSSLNRKTKGYVYCDQLPSLLYTEAVASNIIIKECIRTDSSSALYLFISSSKINESAEGLVKYLAENPITVVYELAEPTYELIDEIGYMDSYANGHIILNDTVIPIQEFKTLAFEEELTYLYANTSYTIQFESDRESHVKFYLGGTEYSTNIIKGLNRVTITTPSTLVDNNLRLNGTDAKISEVVVVNSNKDFEYFEGLQSIGEDGSLEIKSCNKNIIDDNLKNWKLLTGTPTYTFSNEGKTLSVTYTNGWNHGAMLTTRLKKGTYYCGLSKTGNVDMYYNDGTSNDVNISNKTFTISNDTVVNFKLKNTNNVGGTYTVSDVYINEKTDLGYTPHQSNSQVMTHEPLRAIGDIKDRYILKDGKWYIERNCAEVVLDGSENWENGGWSNDSKIELYCKSHGYDAVQNKAMSDILPMKPYGGDYSTYHDVFVWNSKSCSIFLTRPADATSSVNYGKQWLAENPMTVVYQLAEPIYEAVDYNPFEVYSDKTYITTNSVIPPYITVKNTGFNCNISPNTTYTIASNKGIHHITTASELDDSLRFYGEGRLSGLRLLDGIFGDGYAIPSVFKGLQNAFGQEYFGNIANKKLYGSAVRYEKGDIVTDNVTNRVCYIINNPKPDTVYTIISRTQGLISTNSCYLGNEKSTGLTQLSVDIFENGIYTVRTNAEASKALAVNMKYDNERDINIDEIECYVVEGDWSDMTEKDFTDNFGKYKVNFKMRGKNLFDASQVIANKYQSGADDKYAIVDNEEYSLYYLQGISNMIITSNVALSGVWYSNELPIMEQEIDTMFTVPFGCNIFALRIPKNVNINNLQIEVGDESTTYRQYQEHNVTFYIEQPLRSFKDFEDTFMWRENTLFVKRRCGELVLNGSEDWLAYSTNNEANNIAFKLENYLETTYTDYEVYCISDLFTSTTAKNIHNDIEGISFVNKDIIIKINRAKLSTQDVDGFKQYLQNHNTTVVYNTGNIIYEEIGLIDKLLPLYDESTLSYNTIVPVKTTLNYSTKTPSIVVANGNIANLQSINDEQDMQTLELQYKMCLLEMLLEDEEGL